MNFDDSAPVPYGYTKMTRSRTGMIIGGAVTLGATYSLTVFTGALGAFLDEVIRSRRNTDTTYAIPVVGPFMGIANSDSAGAYTYWAVSGLGQTAGVVLLVYGLTSSRTVLRRNDQLVITSIAPLVAPSASGLSVVGRF